MMVNLQRHPCFGSLFMILILCLSVDLSSQADGSPSPEICSPCVCENDIDDDGFQIFNLDCSAQKLTKIPFEMHLPDSVESISLNLSRNHLSSDDTSSSLCQKYDLLKKVSFAWNGFTSLPKSLRGCRDTLEDLTLTGNSLILTDSSDFQELQNLHALRGLEVKGSLPGTVFQLLVDLTHLELLYDADTIPEDLFSYLENLNTLWLTLPSLKLLPNELAFPPSLTELRLRGTQLKELSGGFLKGLSDLKILHLELPQLRRLDWKAEDVPTARLESLTVKGVWVVASETLALLPSLLSLTLQDIRILTDMAFYQQLGKLQNLAIIKCWIDVDNLDWIKDLPTLQSLALRQTNLNTLPGDTFTGLSSLQRLDLSFNSLKRIPDGLFAPVSGTLEVLDMSNNQLNYINGATFPLMSNLKGVDLSQNRLESLDLDAFVNMPALSQLILHGNVLKEMNGQRISEEGEGFTRLSLLDLSGNMLDTIPSSVPFDKVAILDMSGNPLRRDFPVSRLLDSRTTKDDAITVELHDTSVACDCHMHALVEHFILIGGVCNSPQHLDHVPTSDIRFTEWCNEGETTVDDRAQGSTATATMSLPQTTVTTASFLDVAKYSYETDAWVEGEVIDSTVGPLDHTITTIMVSDKSSQAVEEEPESVFILDDGNDRPTTGVNYSAVKNETAATTSPHPVGAATLSNASSIDLDNGQGDSDSPSMDILISGLEKDVEAAEESAKSNLAGLPWAVVLLFILIVIFVGYMVYRKRKEFRSQVPTECTADADDKMTNPEKFELMELGVAPPGHMPVIM